MQAVFHFTPLKPDSTIASAKVARLLAEMTGATIIDRDPIPDCKFDRIFIINSPSAFCPYRDALARLCADHPDVVWIMQDYTIYPPTQMRKTLKRKMQCWSTLGYNPYPGRLTYANLIFSETVNWNMLTWDPMPLRDPTIEGLIYYGAYRLGRVDLFQKYLFGQPFRVNISASRQAMKKFYAQDYHIVEYEPFRNVIASLQAFSSTIYIEDEFSRDHYTATANRFFEAASAGIPIFFDRGCLKNLEEDGIEIDPEWIIDDPSDLRRHPQTLRVYAEAQAKAFRQRDYLGELRCKLSSICGK